MVKVTDREMIISVMANAIGYELEGPGEMSLDEFSKYRRAAERAYRHAFEAENNCWCGEVFGHADDHLLESDG